MTEQDGFWGRACARLQTENTQLQLDIANLRKIKIEQECRIKKIRLENKKLHKSLGWALGCIDVDSWIESGDMKVAVDAFNKAKEALGETK